MNDNSILNIVAAILFGIGLGAIIQALRSNYKSKEIQKKVSPFTNEQLEQVKKLASKQAIKFGTNSAKAEKLSESLIRSLARLPGDSSTDAPLPEKKKK